MYKRYNNGSRPVFVKTCIGFVASALFALSASTNSLAQTAAQSVSSYKIDRLSFSVKIDGRNTNLGIISTMVMPGTALTLDSEAALSSNAPRLVRNGEKWVWTAPSKPGHYEIILSNGPEKMRVIIFVLTPFDTQRQKKMGDYKIGDYQQTAYKGRAEYRPPQGFIAVTDDMKNIQISPHFTLGQFLCKQQSGLSVSFALINQSILMKLERLLDVVNAAGHKANSFHVMSGFRTPWYNKAIGNKTSVSRHLYGDGVDIFIDADNDNYMDDLNNDGLKNHKDAQILHSLAALLSSENLDDWDEGGLSLYKENTRRGPFIHLDSRGYEARW